MHTTIRAAMKHIMLLLWIGLLGAGLVSAQPFEAELITKLTASDAQAGDFFGYPVDLDGNVLAVGVSGHNDNQGAVFIYRRQDNGTWLEEASLQSSDGAANDQFGYTLALDGEVLLVGALQHYEEEVRTGAAYVFAYENGIWTEQQKVLAEDKSQGAFFGESVAFNDTFAFVGASGVQTVYVYDRATWTEQARLEPFEAASALCFACTMAASDDYVVVGDIDNDAAYVYRRTSEGGWEADARLTDDDETDRSYFGEAISIQEDEVLIGAYGDDERGAFAGAAYLYQRGENGWDDGFDVIPGDSGERLNVGRSVLLERDRAFVGAADGIYVFMPDENDTWVEIAKIDADDFVISIQIEHGMLAAGLSLDDDAGENAGAVSLYAVPPANRAPAAATVLTPDGSTTIDLTGDPAQSFTSTWTTAVDEDGDPITYVWQLGLTSDLSAPILRFDTGTETQLETTYGTLATALTAAGVATGSSVTAYAQVIASDGIAETPSAIVQLDFVRGVFTAIEEAGVPGRFVLHAAYPNPFNPQTKLRYALPEAAHVRLAVYDALGREVALLADGTQAVGTHAVTFAAGPLPSGIYLVRMDAGGFVQTQRVTLIK